MRDILLTMQLADDITAYYFAHTSLLSEAKRFHFATRTAAWLGTQDAFSLLHENKNYILEPGTSLKDTLAVIYHAPQTGRRNAHEARQPYFEKYPTLYGAHQVLFRVRHLKEVLGVDARQELYEIISKEELVELKEMLLTDIPALRALSTFAVNFCYLVDRVILEDEASSLPEQFAAVGQTYEINSAEQRQLLIYLNTHCIIGESRFYTRHINNETLPLYTEMLKTIEPLIEEYFESTSLDSKLEFLVSAKICGYESALAQSIYDECQDSLSTRGTFLIDRHNSHAKSENESMSNAEHRNALFIMSATSYSPHSTLIS